MQSNLIIAQTPLVLAAVRQETSVILIVFVDVSDPIGPGFVASLARPGGDVTGLLTFEAASWVNGFHAESIAVTRRQ